MNMIKFYKTTAGILAVLLASQIVSCGDAERRSSDDTTGDAESNPVEETIDPAYETGLEIRDLGGEFRIATFENSNFHYKVYAGEETGELLNDAIYKRNRSIKDTYNISIVQFLYADFSNEVRNSVTAGDDAYDLVTVRCTDALTWWHDGLLIPYDELPNIDLEKKYWDQSINASLTIGGTQYIAEGAFNLDSYDLTFCLAFNKTLAEKHSIDDIYTLVSSGGWTMDAMEKYMTDVTQDLNGDTQMTDTDCWGYTAHPKMVTPGYWIASDVMSISKDENDIPYISMTEQRFVDVFNKIYELIVDSGTAYLTLGDELDIPTECRTIFAENRSLFLDMSFNFIESLRSMDTDFGIIPYPKYDIEQESYKSRVCYYMPTLVPATCTDTDRVGYMLEVLNYESYKTVIPAYYEISLKTKFTRDDESAKMLDLIFSSRVIDIGDSTLCNVIRDKFIYSMMLNNERELISTVKKYEATIEDRLDNLTK